MSIAGYLSIILSSGANTESDPVGMYNFFATNLLEAVKVTSTNVNNLMAEKNNDIVGLKMKAETLKKEIEQITTDQKKK